MSELIERLRDVMTRIGNMCAEGRPPKMSIPARPDYDDDIIICESVKAGIAALEAQAKRIAELEARLAQVEGDAAKQFAAGMERAAGICDNADKSMHPADLADFIRAAKEQK